MRPRIRPSLRAISDLAGGQAGVGITDSLIEQGLSGGYYPKLSLGYKNQQLTNVAWRYFDSHSAIILP